jgi:hypothetical protein
MGLLATYCVNRQGIFWRAVYSQGLFFPKDFILWGYVKGHVYDSNPHSSLDSTQHGGE